MLSVAGLGYTAFCAASPPVMLLSNTWRWLPPDVIGG